MAGVTTETGSWQGETGTSLLTEPTTGMGDEQLLARFLEGREPAAGSAFHALVQRHGPMVLGVCRHVLGELHDAEDAFQATFLVLARNAASIRDRRVLGRWLYEVAYRVAIRSRGRAARRRTHEKEAGEMSAVSAWSMNDPALCELRPVLHEEINRLPETYRTAVVLCYLEGRTNEEAAALLSWPVGTVKGRLSRARDILRSRLTRRGLVLSAALLAALLTERASYSQIISPELAEATTQAALACAREGVQAAKVSPRVRELAEGATPPTSLLALGGTSATAVGLAALFVLAFALFSARGSFAEMYRDLRMSLPTRKASVDKSCADPPGMPRYPALEGSASRGR